MDDPHLTEAIQNNEPDTVSKITDCFFKDALERISAHNSIVGKYLKDGAIQFKPDSYPVFISAVNKEFGELLNDEEEVFILGLHEKVLIMIQLTLWSCINIRGCTGEFSRAKAKKKVLVPRRQNTQNKIIRAGRATSHSPPALLSRKLLPSNLSSSQHDA